LPIRTSHDRGCEAFRYFNFCDSQGARSGGGTWGLTNRVDPSPKGRWASQYALPNCEVTSYNSRGLTRFSQFGYNHARKWRTLFDDGIEAHKKEMEMELY
jgi:hypothetical protein